MATLNEKLEDAALRHEIRIRRVSNALLRELSSILGVADRRISDRLLRLFNGGGSEVSRAGLATSLAEVRRINGAAMREVEEQATGELTDLAALETDWLEQTLNAASPIAFAFSRPSVDQVVAVARDLPVHDRKVAAIFEDWGAGRFKRARNVARQGFVDGLTVDEMATELQAIEQIGRRGARGIVRTLTTHYAAVSRAEFIGANSEVVKAIRWVSTLDSRTSAICRARDGQIFPINSGPRPPAHFGCRSVIVPVVASWSELGFASIPEKNPLSAVGRPFVADTRRKKDIPKSEREQLVGTTRGDENYGEWLRRERPAFVREVLGKTRAKLFMDGGLKLDAFVDDDGAEITIAQLRRRYARAFEKVGIP